MLNDDLFGVFGSIIVAVHITIPTHCCFSMIRLWKGLHDHTKIYVMKLMLGALALICSLVFDSCLPEY